MKKMKTLLLTVISTTILLATQSITAFAGFDLQHYKMTDDGLWLIKPYGESGNSEEGRVTVHFLLDSSSMINYYTAGYYDEDGEFQEATIDYHTAEMTKEDTINGYGVWTSDYGYPVGDWYFAGFSDSFGVLPAMHTLTTDFRYTDENNYKQTPFSVTKEGTVHIFSIMGNEEFINSNLDDFVKWAKEFSGIEEDTTVNEDNVQTAENSEIVPEKTPEVTLSPTVETKVMPTETKIPEETAIPEETDNGNVKATVLGGVILLAVVGGIVFCLRKKR